MRAPALSPIVATTANVAEAPTAPAPAPAGPPPDLTSWKSFIRRARADARTLYRLGSALRPAIVVLGGSGTTNAPETRAYAKSLGTALGKAGLPLRTADRAGAVADLVSAARAESATLRIEAIDADGKADHASTLRLPMQTREIAKRTAIMQASCYVVLPGELEALWEMMQAWTLLRAGMVPDRPLVLVGDKAYWDAILKPLIEPALALKVIKPEYLSHLHYVDKVEDVVAIASDAHKKYRNAQARELERYLPLLQSDLKTMPPLLARFVGGGNTVYGGAGLVPGTKDYEALRKLGQSIVAPVTTGASSGLMEAPARGAKERDPNAVTQGANIKGLKTEQKINAFMDKERVGEGVTLEVRERLIMSADGAFSTFGAGGTGTWVELAQIWRLIADGELPKVPVLLTGFYRRHLEAFFKEAGQRGYLSPEIQGLLTICDTYEELEAAAKAAQTSFNRAETPRVG